MTLKNILITGATGNQGGALITALESLDPRQFKLFALTRNFSSASALRLAERGITVIQGDLSSPIAIFTQIPFPYGVFLVTVPGPHEKAQALPFIDTAIESGVHHIVFASADRGGPSNSETDDPIPIPHFGVKRDIEKYLKSSAENTAGKTIWTILRPTSFMDNLAPGFVGRAVATMLKQMGRTRISLISVKDIGRVAGMAFERPEEFGGRSLTLTGDLLSFVSLLLPNSCLYRLGKCASISGHY
jgi:uncharacterized protein YbjT (DUF2867 family)